MYKYFGWITGHYDLPTQTQGHASSDNEMANEVPAHFGPTTFTEIAPVINTEKLTEGIIDSHLVHQSTVGTNEPLNQPAHMEFAPLGQTDAQPHPIQQMYTSGPI